MHNQATLAEDMLHWRQSVEAKVWDLNDKRLMVFKAKAMIFCPWAFLEVKDSTWSPHTRKQ